MGVGVLAFVGRAGVPAHCGQTVGVCEDLGERRPPRLGPARVENDAGVVGRQEAGDRACRRAEEDGGTAGCKDAVDFRWLDQAFAGLIQGNKVCIRARQGFGQVVSGDVALEADVRHF